MSNLLNTHLEHYYIYSRIGGGRIGDLYGAYDPTPMHERDVAVRIVSRRLMQQSRFRRHFWSIMEQTQWLNDPAVVRVYDFGYLAELNRFYVVTELISSGQTLESILAQMDQAEHVLSLADAIEITRQICLASEYLQVNRAPLRESTPHNIYIRPLQSFSPLHNGAADGWQPLPYQITLTDPGIERFLRGEVETLPPEESIQRREVYELGLLFHRLVTGKEATPEKLIPPLIYYNTVPESERDVIHAVERIIYTALAPNPVHRFDDAGLMALALARALPMAIHFPHGPNGRAVAHMVDYLARPDTESSVELEDHRQEPTVERPESLLDLKTKDNQPVLEVMPGESGIINLVLKNDTQNDHRIELVVSADLPTEWITFPPQTRISHGQERELAIIFRPPKSFKSHAGEYPLEIYGVYEGEARQLSDRVTATLIVAAFHNLQFELNKKPVIEAGEEGQLTIFNHSNVTEVVHCTWSDPQSELAFEVEQQRKPEATAVIEAGESQVLYYRTWPRRPHWFRRRAPYPYTITKSIPNSGTQAIPDAETLLLVRSRPLIPLWALLLICIACLVLIVTLIYEFSPKLVDARGCKNEEIQRLGLDGLTQPSLAVCITHTDRVREIALSSGRVLFTDLKDIDPMANSTAVQSTASVSHTAPISASLVVAPNPNERQNSVELVGRNRLSNILPFLQSRRSVVADVRQPPIGLTSFCIEAQTEECVYASPTLTETISTSRTVSSLYQGSMKSLNFRWGSTNLTEQHKVELLPQAVQFTIDGNQATAPFPTQTTFYTLVLLNGEKEVQRLTLEVPVKPFQCTVNASNGLLLYSSPGTNFATLSDQPVAYGTEIILLNQPVDYQQNNDTFQWTQVAIGRSGEQGWMVYSTSDESAIYIACPLSPTGTASEGSAANTLTSTGSNDGQVEASSGGNAQSGSGINGLNVLPNTIPIFGPTLTRVPTSTPAPTATGTPVPTVTPMPTMTPVPTPAPFVIDVGIDPALVEVGGCVVVTWNITGVSGVYFDYGKGDFLPISGNEMRSEEFCGLKKETTFRWRVILNDGSEQPLKRTVQVTSAQGNSPLPAPIDR